jgi:hypothetical protein
VQGHRRAAIAATNGLQNAGLAALASSGRQGHAQRGSFVALAA